jgi:hypothetical protein
LKARCCVLRRDAAIDVRMEERASSGRNQF